MEKQKVRDALVPASADDPFPVVADMQSAHVPFVSNQSVTRSRARERRGRRVGVGEGQGTRKWPGVDEFVLSSGEEMTW